MDKLFQDWALPNCKTYSKFTEIKWCGNASRTNKSFNGRDLRMHKQSHMYISLDF